MKERLQKVLAHLGLGSRREIEEWIRQGRVQVNGRTVALGEKADPARDHIRVDGLLVSRKAEPHVYYALNKPRGVVTTLSDPEGRKTVKDFLQGVKFRVYPVGRLDYDSEGLLLLTNDGDLAQGLTHPAHHVPRVYHVKVQGIVSAEKQRRFREGIKIEGQVTAPAGIVPLRKTEQSGWYEVTLREGRRRQIRKMFERLGHRVQRLRRVGIGPLALRGLKPGQYRPLTPDEALRLKEAAGRSTPGGPGKKRRRG